MFGTTKCGKCEGASFRVQEISPTGAQFKLFTVQCSSCQTPIGVMDFYNIGQLLKDQEKVIADLGKKLANIESSINQISRSMRQ